MKYTNEANAQDHESLGLSQSTTQKNSLSHAKRLLL